MKFARKNKFRGLKEEEIIYNLFYWVNLDKFQDMFNDGFYDNTCCVEINEFEVK